MKNVLRSPKLVLFAPSARNAGQPKCLSSSFRLLHWPQTPQPCIRMAPHTTYMHRAMLMHSSVESETGFGCNHQSSGQAAASRPAECPARTYPLNLIYVIGGCHLLCARPALVARRHDAISVCRCHLFAAGNDSPKCKLTLSTLRSLEEKVPAAAFQYNLAIAADFLCKFGETLPPCVPLIKTTKPSNNTRLCAAIWNKINHSRCAPRMQMRRQFRTKRNRVALQLAPWPPWPTRMSRQIHPIRLRKCGRTAPNHTHEPRMRFQRFARAIFDLFSGSRDPAITG